MIFKYIQALSISLLLIISITSVQAEYIDDLPRLPITASTIDQLDEGISDGASLTLDIAFHHDSQLMAVINDPSLNQPESEYPRGLGLWGLMEGANDHTTSWYHARSFLNSSALNATDSLRHIVASPTSDRLAVGEDNGVISIWDVTERRIEFIRVTLDNIAITDLIFAPKEDYLLVVEGHKQITQHLFGETFPEKFDMSPEIEYISNLSFNSDGTLLAFGADESVGLWDGDTLEQIGIFPTENETLQKALFHPQLLDTLFTLAGTNVKRWHWDGQQLIEEMSFDIPQFTSVDHFVSAESLSPDGSVLLAVYNQEDIAVWNTETGTLIEVPAFAPWKNPEHRVYGAAFSPDGMWLALGTEGLTFYNIP